MKKSFLLLLIFVAVLAVALAAYVYFVKLKPNSEPTAEPLTKIRIGWQIPWATQGQLVQILKHTDILKNNGLAAEFIGRTYGPELNEAALANELDVVLTADQPAAALFAKDKGWIGIGRLMYNRTSTYVPPASPVKTLSDLKGKTIGVPIGAAAERITAEALKAVGLNPQKDVKIINLDIREQGSLVLKYQNEIKWGDFDALAGFDPMPAILEDKGLVRVLDVGKVVSLVLMNQNYLNQNPGLAEKFLQALFDAYDYYRQNISQANDWFIVEAGLKDASQDVCNLAASLEPNVTAESRDKIRITFSDEDFATMQKGADFIAPSVKKTIDTRQYVSNQYAQNIK